MACPQPRKRKRDDAGLSAAALYVHVPFCLAKCAYCDFYSVPSGQADMADYVEAAITELRRRAGELLVPLASVYVGGGTPTVLGDKLLRRLLAEAKDYAGGDTEWSIEANPCTIDAAVASALVDGGANRVSLGVQSFNSRELAVLGRLHTPRQARAAVGLVRKAGIANISIDLIYGIPGQDLASWRRSLAQAFELGIEHLSCYGLSIEPGTPLWRSLRAGSVRQVDEGVERDCYYAAIDAAGQAGLEHYEISNFARGPQTPKSAHGDAARPDRRCRHNLVYWRNEPYLGIGPAATSYIAQVRRTNLADLVPYVRAVHEGLPAPSWAEHLTGRAAMAETIMLGLRLTEGISRKAFADRYGLDPLEAFPQTTARYSRIGAIEMDDSHLRLTRGTLFVADTVLADFLAEA